jgi:hypothetical protein
MAKSNMQACQHRADQVGTPTDRPVNDKVLASRLQSNPQYGNPGTVANDAPGSTESVIGVNRK